ncbi:MAG TPA: hypothetical protein VK146_03685 [Tabrizicola sp.]|nr:hypothetical protein [Tabrizicola sp.]
MASNKTVRQVILINEDVLGLPPGEFTLEEGARVFVAGRSLVQMTLAELALPGAQMIWTDFRQSASLSALHATLQSAGGLDRLLLAADGAKSEAVFSLMCAVLTFMPALRRRRGSRVEMVLESGQAVGSMVQFLQRIERKLASDGIMIELRIRERRTAPAVA